MAAAAEANLNAKPLPNEICCILCVRHMPTPYLGVPFNHVSGTCQFCKQAPFAISFSLGDLGECTLPEDLVAMVLQRNKTMPMLELMHPTGPGAPTLQQQAKWAEIVDMHMALRYIPLATSQALYKHPNVGLLACLNQISNATLGAMDTETRLSNSFPSMWTVSEQFEILTTTTPRKVFIMSLYRDLRESLKRMALANEAEKTEVSNHVDACDAASDGAAFTPWDKEEGSWESLDKCIKALWDFAMFTQRAAWNQRFKHLVPFLKCTESMAAFHRAAYGSALPALRAKPPAAEESCEQQVLQQQFDEEVGHAAARFVFLHHCAGKRMLQNALGRGGLDEGGEVVLSSLVLLNVFRIVPTTSMCSALTWNKVNCIALPFFFFTQRALLASLMWKCYLYTSLCVLGHLLDTDEVAALNGKCPLFADAEIDAEEVLKKLWASCKDGEVLQATGRAGKTVGEMLVSAVDEIFAKKRRAADFVKDCLLPVKGPFDNTCCMYEAAHCKTELDLLHLMVPSFPEDLTHPCIPDDVRKSFLEEMAGAKAAAEFNVEIHKESYALAKAALAERVWGEGKETAIAWKVRRAAEEVANNSSKKRQRTDQPVAGNSNTCQDTSHKG